MLRLPRVNEDYLISLSPIDDKIFLTRMCVACAYTKTFVLYTVCPGGPSANTNLKNNDRKMVTFTFAPSGRKLNDKVTAVIIPARETIVFLSFFLIYYERTNRFGNYGVDEYSKTES